MAVDPLGDQLQRDKALAGEGALVRKLRAQGWHIFWGGDSHRWNAPGPDVFAYNPVTEQLAFFDDKNINRRTVRTVTSLTSNFETGPARRDARRLIRESNLADETKVSLLERIEEGSSGFKRFVTSAAEEGRARRVSSRLKDLGVEFLELDKPAESKVLGRLTLGLALLGVVMSDDPGRALGEAFDPLGMAGYGNIMGEEAEQRAILEELYFPELARQLEQPDPVVCHGQPAGGRSGAGTPPALVSSHRTSAPLQNDSGDAPRPAYVERLQ